MHTPLFYSSMYNTKDRLKEKYLGKKVHVIIDDDTDYLDKVGVVEFIDDIGQLHGTWGSLAVMPEVDYVEILN